MDEIAFMRPQTHRIEMRETVNLRIRGDFCPKSQE